MEQYNVYKLYKVIMVMIIKKNHINIITKKRQMERIDVATLQYLNLVNTFHQTLIFIQMITFTCFFESNERDTASYSRR